MRNISEHLYSLYTIKSYIIYNIIVCCVNANHQAINIVAKELEFFSQQINNRPFAYRRDAEITVPDHGAEQNVVRKTATSHIYLCG